MKRFLIALFIFATATAATLYGLGYLRPESRIPNSESPAPNSKPRTESQQPTTEGQAPRSSFSQFIRERAEKILPSPTPVPLPTIPESKTLPGSNHVFQSFNNCGPASLSMTLSIYGIDQSQAIIGNQLRPYQNSAGDNDDKSVTLEELAIKAEEYGFVSYHRPAGNFEILEQFIGNDMPVITRTITKVGEDIGHYRVVKGYDQTRDIIIQDDSLQGKNLEYTHNQFNQLWKVYNYEFLVLVPPEKQQLAEAILGNSVNEQTAWQQAKANALQTLDQNSQDIFARFNLAIAEYHLGNYQQTINHYEQVEAQLPFRTLWYQIEPILAYYQLGDYNRVFQITDQILNNGNRAYAELYLIRSQIYDKQGNTQAAQAELDRANLFNPNLIIRDQLLEELN